MGAVVPWLVFLVVLAALIACLVWLAARVRRRGAGRELMAPVDLIYRPHTHLLNQEIVIQDQRAAETPAPGDPLRRRGGDPAE
jgi:hypothetical protein